MHFYVGWGPSKVRVFQNHEKSLKGPKHRYGHCAHRDVIYIMGYVNGTIKLCSAQPTRLYEVILDARLGRVLFQRAKEGMAVGGTVSREDSCALEAVC